ncbi:NADH-quinone oxidoreductase subunit D [Longivirga aurantiaca]|uniref:NADH-quinone oxidoreductase subunit D n=1 Tax=Longivirga aurantiaca TaxID=1837743 RepID=A0ABW1SZ00_9ACTN
MTAARHEVVLSVGSGLPVPARDGLPTQGLDLGAAHPSSHGVIQLRVVVEGDRIVEAEPRIGFLHRGAEKLFEVRDYRQAMVLANRHDWLSAFGNELGIALAVERMLGMEVPERAVWLRTLLAELNRVLVHLAFLGSFPAASGVARPAYPLAVEREAVQRVLEEATGGRMHLMFNRVGGLREDVPASWTTHLREHLPVVRAGLEHTAAFLASDELRAATRGVGVLTAEQVQAYGVSGPMARAAGVDLDLRRDDPYLAYASLADAGVFRVVTRSEGDALARLEVLLEQTYVSLDVVAACADRLDAIGPAPVNLKLPKVLRAPEGMTYVWTENPLGTSGWLLVSRAEKTPWRLALRSASFSNVAVLGELLVGARVADLVTILATCPYVVGDVDA